MDSTLVTISAHLSPVPLFAVTLVVAFISGFIPFVSIEAYLVAVVALRDASSAPALALASAAGQMTAKCVLYFSGRGILRLPFGRHRSKIENLQARIEKRGTLTGPLLFISAFTGFPPFYAVSVLSGTLGVPLPSFLTLGFLGRLLRFGLVAYFPRFLARLWG